MSARDARLVALSKLNGAQNDIIQARRELQDVQRGMRLLGMYADNGIEVALNAISLAADRVHAARCALWGEVSDEMKGR